MDYETEEQQVEALKSWWSENGRSVVLGVVIGAVAIGGWQWWGAHKLSTARDASDKFAAAIEGLNTDNRDAGLSAAQVVRDEHKDSIYAVLASLAEARSHVENNQLEAAATALRWAAENASEADIAVIAKIRLARVLGASGDHDAAIAALPVNAPTNFRALVEEARGDLLLAKGDTDLARDAYQAALDSGERSADSRLLNMKLDDLATAEPSS